METKICSKCKIEKKTSEFGMVNLSKSANVIPDFIKEHQKLLNEFVKINNFN